MIERPIPAAIVRNKTVMTVVKMIAMSARPLASISSGSGFRRKIDTVSTAPKNNTMQAGVKAGTTFTSHPGTPGASHQRSHEVATTTDPT